MSSEANEDGSAEELNEEDQNLKNELEMLVSRLKVAIDERVSQDTIWINGSCVSRSQILAFIYLPSMPSEIS